MSYLILNICILAAIIPLASSLHITLESAPVQLQSTPITLCREDGDPFYFLLGAFSSCMGRLEMMNKTTQSIMNFTTNRTVFMTFDHSSLSGDFKDFVLFAWLPEVKPGYRFAESEPFAVNPVKLTSTPTTSKPSVARIESGTASSVSGSIPASTVMSNVPFSTTSSVSGSIPASTVTLNVPPQPVSHTGVIVGGALGLLALGCMISACIYIVIRRRKSTMLTGASLRRPVPSTLTPFPLNSSSMRFPQTYDPESPSKAYLQGEDARVQEEIMALEKRIRHMEDIYWNSHPPSYRSA